MIVVLSGRVEAAGLNVGTSTPIISAGRFGPRRPATLQRGPGSGWTSRIRSANADRAPLPDTITVLNRSYSPAAARSFPLFLYNVGEKAASMISLGVNFLIDAGALHQDIRKPML